MSPEQRAWSGAEGSLCTAAHKAAPRPANLSGFGLKSAVTANMRLWPEKLAAGEFPTVSICIQSSCSFWQSHRLYRTHTNLPQSLFLTFHVLPSDTSFNHHRLDQQWYAGVQTRRAMETSVPAPFANERSSSLCNYQTECVPAPGLQTEISEQLKFSCKNTGASSVGVKSLKS